VYQAGGSALWTSSWPRTDELEESRGDRRGRCRVPGRSSPLGRPFHRISPAACRGGAVSCPDAGRADRRRPPAGCQSPGPGRFHATGAVRATTNDLALIKTVMTFSLPDPIWGRPQSRLPDRGRLHGSPRRADPARLLHLDPRVLGLDHREPGHAEGVLPQHLCPRCARHHPHLRGEACRPRLDREPPPRATPAVSSVTPQPGWNTSCVATSRRPPPSPGRIRSWSRTLTGQAAPPGEPGCDPRDAKPDRQGRKWAVRAHV